jgi:hypothetical protein
MVQNVPFIFAALLLDGLAGLSGALLSERWLIQHQAGLVGFAAGAILGAVFLDVLSESVSVIGPHALVWAFGGFVVLAIAEWLIGHHHHEHGAGSPSLPASLLISDAMHNRFSFNLGVEIGQLAIIVAVASALAALRAHSEEAWRRLVIAGSVVIVFAGAFWFIQRVFFVV